ncbi:hypothetical protein [Caballeronia cordobensis]|uniref:hypothetical protein n=1 Tax=Caballeronia cordobensis TaxID=1353886 RepID=UPI0009EA3B2B|nr:hypothetical protein [Caballeronia cordobensis]
MKIRIEQAKAIYREAIDPRASDGESPSWWHEIADEIEQVARAMTERDAAAVIAWWHHDWSLYSDSPACAARRIRHAARAVKLSI